MRLLYKAPTDNTKPQQTIQSPNRQYKNPTLDKTRHIRQSPNRQHKAPVSSDIQRPNKLIKYKEKTEMRDTTGNPDLTGNLQ